MGAEQRLSITIQTALSVEVLKEVPEKHGAPHQALDGMKPDQAYFTPLQALVAA